MERPRVSRLDYSHEKGLYDQIKYLMILRVVIITTFMLGALFLFYRSEEDDAVLSFLVGLIIFLYLLTIIYSLLLNRIKNLRAFAYFQIIGDILFETGLIYISGAIFSPLSFLYILSIITASIMLYTYGAYFIASMSCIAYGIMAALSQNNILLRVGIFVYSHSFFSTGEVLYKLFVNFCAFYLVAYLANYLIEGLRQAGQELDTKQEDLTRLQKLNDNILRSIDSGLMTIDLGGQIISCNQAAERITGFSAAEIRGQEAKAVFDIDPLFFSSSTPISSDRFNRHEHLFTTPSGKNVFLGFSRSVLYDEEGVNAGYIIIFQDLTDFKRLENAQKRIEKMAILGEMAARMAHEIRNPLTSMKGSIEIISKDLQLNESNQRLMEIVIRESDRLNTLISDFLQYAHSRKLISQHFSLSNLVKETIILLENHPKMVSTIKLDVKLPEEEVSIYGDLFQIKQVILNLCLNGIDAMPDGGTLSVSLICSEDELDGLKSRIETDIVEDSVVLCISDTGTGIQNDFKDQIFTPFFSTKEDGTGLGLAIAYRIIEEHGGYIDYQTELGNGTLFVVIFPHKPQTTLVETEGKQNEQSVNR